MPDTLLLETGTDRFLLEDGSGFLTMEVPRCYFDVVMADAPIAYWRLDDATGTVAADVLGSNPGSYVGSPTLGAAGALAGDLDTAVTFNGTTQYVTVPDANSLDLADGNITYELWVRNPGSGTPYLMEKGVQVPTLRMVSGQVRWDNRGYLAQVSSGAVTIPNNDNTWHHVVGTKAAGGATWKLYIDGADVTTVVNSTNGDTVSTTAAIFIGNRSELDSWYSGSLDEVALYNVALTALQVQTHYNSAAYGCVRPFGKPVLQAMNRAATI